MSPKKENEKSMKDEVLMPQTLSEKVKMAEMFAKSGLMPSGLKTPAQVLVALQMGHELGIPPMRAIQNIAVIEGKPTLHADVMLAVALKTGEVESVEYRVTEESAIVKMKRRGFPTYTSEFTMNDAKRAGLLSRQNWSKYPKRMMKARALAFAVRDLFPDVLAGIYMPDEISGSSPSDIEAKFEPVPAELAEAELAEEEVDLDTLKAKIMQVGVRSFDLLQEIAPHADRVNRWLSDAKKARDIEGLKAFEQLLDKELEAQPPANGKGGQHAAPAPREPRIEVEERVEKLEVEERVEKLEEEQPEDPDDDGPDGEIAQEEVQERAEPNEAVLKLDLQNEIIRELGRVGDVAGIPAIAKAIGHAQLENMSVSDRMTAVKVLKTLPTKQTEGETDELSGKARHVLSALEEHCQKNAKSIFIPSHIKLEGMSFADVEDELIARKLIKKSTGRGFQLVGFEPVLKPLSAKAQAVLACVRDYCQKRATSVFVAGDVPNSTTGKTIGNQFLAVKEELIAAGRIERSGLNGWKLLDVA